LRFYTGSAESANWRAGTERPVSREADDPLRRAYE